MRLGVRGALTGTEVVGDVLRRFAGDDIGIASETIYLFSMSRCWKT